MAQISMPISFEDVLPLIYQTCSKRDLNKESVDNIRLMSRNCRDIIDAECRSLDLVFTSSDQVILATQLLDRLAAGNTNIKILRFFTYYADYYENLTEEARKAELARFRQLFRRLLLGVLAANEWTNLETLLCRKALILNLGGVDIGIIEGEECTEEELSEAEDEVADFFYLLWEEDSEEDLLPNIKEIVFTRQWTPLGICTPPEIWWAVIRQAKEIWPKARIICGEKVSELEVEDL